MNRVVIPRQDLYDLLHDRFREAQAGCPSCKTPFPFYCDTSDGPNWRVAVPPMCESQCRTKLLAIVSQMASEYQLSPPLWRQQHQRRVASGD